MTYVFNRVVKSIWTEGDLYWIFPVLGNNFKIKVEEICRDCSLGFLNLVLSRFLLWSLETATSNLPRISLMWSVFYLSIWAEIFCIDAVKLCNFCSNLTIRNLNCFDKGVLISLLLTWNTFTHGCTIFTIGKDQVNAAVKDIDPVASLIS